MAEKPDETEIMEVFSKGLIRSIKSNQKNLYQELKPLNENASYLFFESTIK